MREDATTPVGRLVTAIVLCASAPLAPQVVQIADVHTGAGPIEGSRPASFVVVGDTCFFTAQDVTHGRELWATDGSSGGTRLVKEIYPGTSSGVNAMAAFDGLLYFTGNDGSHGRELWRSDGTSAGTVLVEDIRPGPAGSSPDQFAVVGNRLYFAASTDDEGRELWYVEGGQVVSLGDVRTGSESLSPQSILPWGASHFVFEGESTGAGRELWVSDGTLAGTQLLADVVPGETSSHPLPLLDVYPALFFSAQDSTHGRELWVLLPAATHAGYDIVMLGDLRPGTTSSSPSSMMILGSTILFTAFGPTGRELWVTNGTAAGTKLLVDIDGGTAPGVRSSLTLFEDRVYFTGWTSATGEDPWVSDGTVEGTEMLENIESGSASSNPRAFVPLADGYLYFLITNAQGSELWRTDGSSSGTSRRAYRDDGTTVGSTMVSLAGTQLLLSAWDVFAGEELWRGGASGGLQRLANIAPDFGDAYPVYYVEASGRLYFSAQDDAGRELWTSDLTSPGTYRVEDLYPGPLGSAVPALEWNGALYSIGFSLDEGQELRKVVDPSLGSAVVRDILPGPGSSSPGFPVPFQDRLLFMADEPSSGRELFTSDGTEIGTILLDEVQPGAEDGLSYSLFGAELDGHYYFAGDDGVHGEELWRTDGSSVELVRDLYLGPSDSFPNGFTVLQGELYFAAWTESGNELWKSDGTPQGTRLVRDIHPSGHAYPLALGVVGSHLLFGATRPDSGGELWRTDGTEEGTELLADIWPGPSSSLIRDSLVIGGLLYFVATDPVYGQEIWRSDGTAAGTKRVTDIAPGPEHSVELSPFTSVVIGDWFVFTATDGVTGREPWAYRWKPETPLFADGFEGGDTAAWSGSQ
jgi:ELWxxDGT repeat protein